VATKRNIGNLASLACIQISNALLPIIAFPIILNVVGTDLFSKIAISEAIALIAVAFVLYSFEVDGVSKIAALNLKSDIFKISHIFSGVLYVRLLIWTICVFLLLLSYPFLDKDIFILLIGWMLFPLSYIFQSYWVYQGLEKNLFPAILTLVTRLLCLISLIKIVIAPMDYYYVPIIIGISYGTGGGISLLYLLRKFKIKLVKVSLSEIYQLFLEGKEIFFGNISVTLFRDSNVIILGIFSNSTAVSIYSIAEKSIKIFQAGARPLNQLFFPKVIRSLLEIKKPDLSAFKIIAKYTWPQIAALFLAAILIILFYVFFRDVLPNKYDLTHEKEIVYLITVMAVAVFFGVSNFMFGIAGLNYLNKRWHLARAIFITGVCSILCCIPLVLLFAQLGAALSFVLSEVLLFCLISKAYFNK
jgi:O-antigen/teichoic acid export membrane protein